MLILNTYNIYICYSRTPSSAFTEPHLRTTDVEM